jgi:hypothetical protein
MRVRKHRGREKLIFTLRREEPLAAQLLQNTLPYLICFTLGTTITVTACNDSRSCNKRGVSAQGREMEKEQLITDCPNRASAAGFCWI